MIPSVKNLIPENHVGKPTNLSTSIILSIPEEAKRCFNRASRRLLNPQVWHKLSDWANAHFDLAGTNGEEKNRLVEEGDYLKIDIPGPGSYEGEGFDWLRVEKISMYNNPKGTSEWTYLRLHACTNPGKIGSIADFFKSEASSSYVIERNGNFVTARYHGRNEIPNLTTDPTFHDQRNITIATGAVPGFSEVQWMALLKGLLAGEMGD